MIDRKSEKNTVPKKTKNVQKKQINKIEKQTKIFKKHYIKTK